MNILLFCQQKHSNFVYYNGKPQTCHLVIDLQLKQKQLWPLSLPLSLISSHFTLHLSLLLLFDSITLCPPSLRQLFSWISFLLSDLLFFCFIFVLDWCFALKFMSNVKNTTNITTFLHFFLLLQYFTNVLCCISLLDECFALRSTLYLFYFYFGVMFCS